MCSSQKWTYSFALDLPRFIRRGALLLLQRNKGKVLGFKKHRKYNIGVEVKGGWSRFATKWRRWWRSFLYFHDFHTFSSTLYDSLCDDYNKQPRWTSSIALAWQLIKHRCSSIKDFVIRKMVHRRQNKLVPLKRLESEWQSDWIMSPFKGLSRVKRGAPK